MAEMKQLYMAKSWKELNSMCKSKIPANQTKKQQIEFLNRMWTAFLDAKEQKDQERQCVLLLMFIEDSMTLGVQSSPDFKRRLEQAFKRAEVLKDQLKLRYIRLKEETKKAEAECQKEEELARTTTPYAFDLGKSQPMKDTQLSSSGSGSSTSNPNKTARYVQPRDVYGWMESENSVLLLDTRSIRIYKSLHIKTIHNSHSVSVPEEVLTKNNLVLKDIDMNIEDDAKAFWAKRNTYKFVVMFDQNTSQDSSTAWHSNFPRLDRILREDGVSDIYIMNGGFREWYKLYPTQCDGTNPTMAPVTNRDAAKIDYPTVGTLNQLSMSVPAHSAKSAHLYPMFGTGTRPISEYETDTDESSDEETPAAVGVSAPAVIRTSKPSLQGPPLLPKPTTPKVSAPPIPVSAKPITAPATVVAKKPRRLKTKKIADPYNVHTLTGALPQYVKRAGLVGLVNVGNTCYLNSIIQCLSNTMPFSTHFIQQTYRKDINRNNPLGTGGQLAETFGDLLQIIWKGSDRTSSFKPDRLKNVISQFAPRFSGREQHDAQELLSFLMDGLHEDLNCSRDRTYQEDPDYDGNDAQTAALSWTNYKRRNDSVVVDLFQGQFRSELKCLTCGNKSVTFNPFMYLSVPVPANVSQATLKKCIDTFTARERVAGNDQWYCGNCKKHRDAEKRLSIWRLPPVLLIHFKRFQSDAFGNSRAKINTMVDFPIGNLDLSSYLPNTDRQNAQNHSYHLLSVANHWGQMGSGHYTAFCRNVFDRKWHDFDDSTVKPMDESRVKTPGAYVLGYINSQYFNAYSR